MKRAHLMARASRAKGVFACTGSVQQINAAIQAQLDIAKTALG